MPLRAADISDPRNPVLLPPIEPQLAASGAPTSSTPTRPGPRRDGTRLYVGGQLVFDNEELLVVDIANWPAEPAPVLGSARRWPATRSAR